MNIPYTAYEIQFNYRIGTVMLKQMEIEVENKIKEISRKLFPVEEAPSDVTSSSLGKSIRSVKITAETIIYAQWEPKW